MRKAVDLFMILPEVCDLENYFNWLLRKAVNFVEFKCEGLHEKQAVDILNIGIFSEFVLKKK